MSQPGIRWEPWTRASLASPAFACLCSGLLVVLDEARKRFGCGCEVAVVGIAFIFDLLVVVALVADGETAASVSTGAAVKAEAGWRGSASSATEFFTRGGCGSEITVAGSAGFRLDSAGPVGCSASRRERMQISVESIQHVDEGGLQPATRRRCSLRAQKAKHNGLHCSLLAGPPAIIKG